jgi:hypothetical protein
MNRKQTFTIRQMSMDGTESNTFNIEAKTKTTEAEMDALIGTYYTIV